MNCSGNRYPLLCIFQETECLLHRFGESLKGVVVEFSSKMVDLQLLAVNSKRYLLLFLPAKFLNSSCNYKS